MNDEPKLDANGNPIVPDAVDAAQLQKDLASALAQKDHFREKLEKAEAERIALEKKLNEKPPVVGEKPTLDVVDYIDISSSLDGLDPREKARLAEEHTLTKKPLREIRESEDFQLWQSAYRAKQEKERALKPDGTQATEDVPKTLNEALKTASLAEKEEILRAAGLYRDPRPNLSRTNIRK